MIINELELSISNLSLPETSHKSLSFCSATQEEVAAYLAQLPHGKPVELCNQLYKLLPELAALEASPGRKLALLNTARSEALGCARNLTRNVSITPATTKALSLSIAMLRHLAKGYKEVLVQALREPVMSPNIATGAIYSSINILTQILMECWQFYLAPPTGTWREIHSLYRIARLKKIQSIGIAGTDRETTIKAAYVAPLLLSCLDPTRYAPAELRQIMDFLTIEGNLVEFTDQHGRGLFTVDQDSDIGPQYRFKVSGTTARQFRIRTDKLVTMMREKAAATTLKEIPNRLVTDLCRYWSEEVKRKEEPAKDNTPATIVFGLGHIHRQFTGTNSMEDYRNAIKGTPKGDLSVLAVEQNEGKGQGTFLKQNNWNFNYNPKDKPVDFSAPESNQSVQDFRGTRTNFTADGARLEFESRGETISAGELVAFKLDNDTEWELGIVRWTRITSKLTRKVGVELYNDGFAPCMVSQITKTSGGERQYYPAILMHGQGQTSIIVSALPFKEYTYIRIDDHLHHQDIRLLKTIDETYHIARYAFQTLDNAKPVHKTSPKGWSNAP